MRKFHRWIAPVFAAFFLWIAVTGITIHIIELQMPPSPDEEEARAITLTAPSLIPSAQAHEHDAPKPAAAQPAAVQPAAAPAAAPAPKSPDELKRARLHDLSEFVMDLHSGKILGPIGTWLSIFSGLALIFLAGSGLWMYIEMFRRRAHRHSHPKRFFW